MKNEDTERVEHAQRYIESSLRDFVATMHEQLTKDPAVNKLHVELALRRVYASEAAKLTIEGPLMLHSVVEADTLSHYYHAKAEALAQKLEAQS